MLKKWFLMFFIVFLYGSISAQLVVASPSTDTAIETQTALMTEFAIQEQIKNYNYYVEYISQFIEVISSIKNTASAMKNISGIGKKLKEKSAKAWLNEVESELSDVVPGFSEIKSEISGKVGALFKGSYAGYIEKWGSETKKYYEDLVENYENHVMFPDLYPISSKLKEGMNKSESAQKIVHKAWVESGFEYEMKDDMVRKNTFRKYYEEYMKQAKSDENIEAVGLANIMQAEYLSSEALEHLKKNSDINAIREQFEKDAQDSYRKMIQKLLENSAKNSTPSGNKTIFGLENKRKE